MNVAPSTTFEATTKAFAAGATVGVRIRDNQGNDTLGRTTVGVTEDVTVGTSCVKRRTFTGVATAGQYTIVWDDGTDVDTEELVVTSDAAAAVGSGNLYVTAGELKETLELEGTTFADADIALACSAASRAIDGYKSQRFYPVTETRDFTGDRSDNWIDVGPVVSVSSVTVDEDGSGSYGTTWVSGTDFSLDPPNATDDGIPYRRILLLRNAGRRFPCYANSVRVTGSFGWSEAPPQVAQAATILAGRLLKRARETPYGILTVTGDAVTAARLGRIDPDVAFLLDNLPGARTPLMV